MTYISRIRMIAAAVTGLFVLGTLVFSMPDTAQAQQTNSGRQNAGKTNSERWSTTNRWGGGHTNAPRSSGGCQNGCLGNLDPYDPVNIRADGDK